MSLGYGIGAALAIVLGYIFALPERSGPVLKHMTDAKSITIEPALLAKLWAIWTQRLVVHLRVVDVFAFIHPRAGTLQNISWWKKMVREWDKMWSQLFDNTYSCFLLKAENLSYISDSNSI